MERKGWTTSETARQVSHFLGQKDKFSRAHLWQYLQGKSLPRTRYLQALSRALDMRPEDLIPRTPALDQGRRAPADNELASAPKTLPVQSSAPRIVHVRDYGDGTALVQVSERVSWETALSVLKLLKGPSDESSPSSD
jgi:transcriptional regulator with XRE-family HTH domain